MTVYKAFRNFYIFLISFAVLLGGLLGGFAAYKICYAQQNAVYAVSKYGSNGAEVMELQKKAERAWLLRRRNGRSFRRGHAKCR